MPQQEYKEKNTVCSKSYNLSSIIGLIFRVLVSTKTFICLFFTIICLQLCFLAVGLDYRMQSYINRLEKVQFHAIELALIQTSAMEAKATTIERMSMGSASIGITPKASTKENQAPRLRPRDIETILNQETNALLEQMEEALIGSATNNSSNLDLNTEAKHPSRSDASEQSDEPEINQLIREGISSLVAGDMRSCVLKFEQALTIDQEHPALLYYYGLAYDKLRNPKKAREYFSKLYKMRSRAGKYFDKAAHRLTYGFPTAGAMRGKISFGAFYKRQSLSPDFKDEVDIVIPVLLAQGEEILPEDIYIHIQFFDQIGTQRIETSRHEPILSWQNQIPTWKECEEKLFVKYRVTQDFGYEMQGLQSDSKYYGFTAKLYYKGEPMDCISTPSALILHEFRLRNANSSTEESLIPFSDDIEFYDEAIPSSEGIPFSDNNEEPFLNF